MKLNALLTLACLFILLLPGCNSSDDAITFKFNMPKGSKFNYTVGMNMDMNQAMMGKEMKMNTTITMAYDFDVINDSAGLKTIAATISKVGMDMNVNGMTMKYDSDSPNADTTGPMAKVGKIFGAIKGGQFNFTINENGEVGQVTGMKEMVSKILMGMPGEDTVMANQTIEKTFNEQSFKQNLQQSFAVYPGKPVKVGESWNKVLTMNNNNMVMKLNTTYTLESVTGNNIKIKADAKITSDGSTPTPDMQMDMAGDLKGVTNFDLPTGMPLDGNGNMQLNIKVKAQGQEMPVKMDMKITITGKKI